MLYKPSAHRLSVLMTVTTSRDVRSSTVDCVRHEASLDQLALEDGKRSLQAYFFGPHSNAKVSVTSCHRPSGRPLPWFSPMHEHSQCKPSAFQQAGAHFCCSRYSWIR